MEKNLGHQTAINEIISQIDQPRPEGIRWQQYLDTLERFECWKPLFRLLQRKISDKKTREIADFVRLAKIYILHLEDIKSGAMVCIDLMNAFPISYQDFRIQVLSNIIYEEDFGHEAKVLDSIYPQLKSNQERIECLERLCLIYEKKKYDEDKLNEAYENLIALDENNIKALRYFKAVFTQNQDWENVVSVLKVLYESSRHKNDAFRIAQELATVYLFQLDLPQSCLDVLDAHCKGSPLDTSSLYYEACYRKRDWNGCLEVLSSYLTKIDNDTNRAIIYLKMGELHELLGDMESAIDCYEMSHSSQKSMLESVENLVEIYIEQQNWDKVVEWLGCMRETTDKPQLRERLEEAISRINDGRASL